MEPQKPVQVAWCGGGEDPNKAIGVRPTPHHLSQIADRLIDDPDTKPRGMPSHLRPLSLHLLLTLLLVVCPRSPHPRALRPQNFNNSRDNLVVIPSLSLGRAVFG